MSLPPPKRDSQTGRWKFRKAVPLDLRERVGKQEIIKWLGADAPKAREANGELHLYWDKRFAALRGGAGDDTLSPRDAAVLSGEWYRWFVSQREHEGDTSPAGWLHTLDMLEDIRSSVVSRDDESEVAYTEQDEFAQPQRTPSAGLLERRVNAFLESHGHVERFLVETGRALSDESLRGFLRTMLGDFYAAHRILARRAGRDFGKDEHAEKLPTPSSATPTSPPRRKGLGILDVWEKYASTIAPAASTVRRWAPAIKAFDAFIEGRGMETVTPGDATLFADHRVTQGVSATSVHKVELAGVKRMFSFAHKRDWLAVNPLAGLRSERRSNEDEREREGRDFHPPEYRAILRASRNIYAAPGRFEVVRQNATRWVPWICAYSGARPGEAIQLRKEDFGIEDGIPFFHIRGSAGTVKTGKGRKTPIHRHLIAQGLIDFVHRAADGHLFVSIKGEGEKAVAQAIDTARGRLGEWVRSIGVNDPEISPNHAWRHTFKTIAHDTGMSEKTADAICGHSPPTQGRKYGKVSLAAKAAALAAFPEFALEEASAALRAKGG
ncbi:DUF6538 domain-containing protein [Labrys monachus]|uniref:Integrase n=1 Tax=Labrys monachus TaxID=217067 RepID=A0ABU0FDE5_9HYPH|nr:DUF6538 domain-containing protein [Labrys monachus]MDQ0392632.1 integrase [Labrys monachus]